MEDQEVIVGMGDFGGCVSLSNEKLEEQVSSCRESENLGVDLLEDFDSYWDDINDRLMISRMVSDTVIKGMVKEVEQAAEEKIAAKELEVETLKKRMHFHQLGADRSESSGSPLVYREARSEENGLCFSFSDGFVEHDKIRESLGSLRNVARGQIEKLKKEIGSIRGCSSIKRIGSGSGSELLGLSGILQEKASESLTGVDKTLDTLKTTLDDICTQADDMVNLTKVSLCEWQQEQEFQREIEAMVIPSSIRSLREEYEEKLWHQSTRLCKSQSVNWLEMINEVSNIRKELDAISKSVSNPETGPLISHGSHDMDHYHRKALANHVAPLLWEGNGVFEESKNGMPENWDAAQLKHMKKEELVNYFNSMIVNMRRNHESKVQELTEEFFSLKREYMKEKGSSLPHRKDKDLEILRKKISEVILKLDDILVENEKLAALSNNAETIDGLKIRLDSLLLENRQLGDSLSDTRKEVKCRSSQVSDAAEKLLQHSLAEANLLKLISNLESEVKDTEIEASVTEEVYKCFLWEVTPQINCNNEELELQSIVMHENYKTSHRGVAKDAEGIIKCEIEDSDIDSLVTQGLCEVIFREAMNDVLSQINDFTKNRVSLELKSLEREEELRLATVEKERLKQEIHVLVASLDENDKLRRELSAALVKEKEQFQIASQEINNLKDQTSRLQTLVTEKCVELVLMEHELAEVEADKEGEINKLNQKVELRTKEFREADEHRNVLLGITQEKQNDILLLEAKENEHRKQMQEVIVLVLGLSRELSDLECQVGERIKKNNSRLEESSSQLSSLVQKTNLLRSTTLLYKKKLERRCNDLQMAEAEVDLLGDEVDALLSLLEKIYIALDHYSPIFQHYPGVIDILKLVRRELSRESTKSI